MTVEQIEKLQQPKLRQATNLRERLRNLDWAAIHQGLWDRGYAKTSTVLTFDECNELINMYSDDTMFRSRVEMARYRFGKGEYKYFAYPLPRIVHDMRSESYSHLAPIANRWNEALALKQNYPEDLETFLQECVHHRQVKPSPLLLKYEDGDYNCLHQDLLGDVAFPFQLTCALSCRNVDYAGGEFLLVERGHWAQSRAEVITADRGELLIFTTNWRPLPRRTKFSRAQVRHGVSRVTSGNRYTLGIIFHDSK
jgi:hypothetical protein